MIIKNSAIWYDIGMEWSKKVLICDEVMKVPWRRIA